MSRTTKAAPAVFAELADRRIWGSEHFLRVAHSCHMSEETEPFCLDGRQHLGCGAGSELVT